MGSGPRGTRWVFTKQLTKKEGETKADCVYALEKFCDTYKVHYCIVGFEIAPTTGQPHLQGFIHLAGGNENRRYRPFFNSNIFKAFWEVAIKDDFVQQEYCSKDKEVVVNFGKPTGAQELGALGGKKGGKKGGDATKKKWVATKQLAKANRIEEVDPQIYVCHYNTLKRIAGDNIGTEPRIDDELTTHFLWLYGEPGCGKSKWIRDVCIALNIQYYTKGTSHMWWDDYKGEPITLLDDFSLKDAEKIGGQFKTWMDHYAFQAQVKGGMRLLRPQFVVVTSNYKIEDVGFPDETTVKAVLRRFQQLQWDGLNAAFSSYQLFEQDEDQLRKDWATDQREMFTIAVRDWPYTKKWKEIQESQAAAAAIVEELDNDDELGIDVENESLGSVAAEREAEAACMLASQFGNQTEYFGSQFETQQVVVDLSQDDEEEEY